MARDLRLYDKSNQKKVTSVFASTLVVAAAGVAVDDILSTIPKDSLLLKAHVIVEKGSGNSGDVIKLVAGGDDFVVDLPIDAAGVFDGTITPVFLKNGGLLTSTGAAPAAEAKYKIVVEYVETELSTNTYTY